MTVLNLLNIPNLVMLQSSVIHWCVIVTYYHVAVVHCYVTIIQWHRSCDCHTFSCDCLQAWRTVKGGVNIAPEKVSTTITTTSLKSISGRYQSSAASNPHSSAGKKYR